MMRCFLSAIVLCLTMVMAGCNQDEDCVPAYVDSVSVPEDSLCFGNWEWAYTLKHARSTVNDPFNVVDTIFPGDPESGFGTVHFANGTVGKAEIYFNINGTIVCGCYKRWNSVLYPAIEPFYVGAIFYEWKIPENQSLVLEPRFPTEPDNIVLARTLGLPMFEVSEQQEDTVFYRNWFVKVE